MLGAELSFFEGDFLSMDFFTDDEDEERLIFTFGVLAFGESPSESELVLRLNLHGSSFLFIFEAGPLLVSSLFLTFEAGPTFFVVVNFKEIGALGGSSSLFVDFDEAGPALDLGPLKNNL